MAGHMGDEQVTEECLEVIKVDSVRNLLLVKGAIPGSNNGFVKVSLSHKKDKSNAQVSKRVAEEQAANEVADVEETNEA